MAQYGGLSLPLAASIAGLLVAYLALFPAFFGLVSHALIARYGPRGLLLVPLAWTATEYGRLTLFGGFPWVLLGYSQVPWLRVAQVASLVGVFGVSTIVAAVSTARHGLSCRRRSATVPGAPRRGLRRDRADRVWGAVRLSSGTLLDRRAADSQSASSRATCRRIRNGIPRRRGRSSTATCASRRRRSARAHS